IVRGPRETSKLDRPNAATIPVALTAVRASAIAQTWRRDGMLPYVVSCRIRHEVLARGRFSWFGPDQAEWELDGSDWFHVVRALEDPIEVHMIDRRGERVAVRGVSA